MSNPLFLFSVLPGERGAGYLMTVLRSDFEDPNGYMTDGYYDEDGDSIGSVDINTKLEELGVYEEGESVWVFDPTYGNGKGKEFSEVVKSLAEDEEWELSEGFTKLLNDDERYVDLADDENSRFISEVPEG